MVTITTGGVPEGGGLLLRWRSGDSGVDDVGERKRYVRSQTKAMKAARMEPYVFRALRWRRVVVEEREGLYAAAVVDDFRG